MKKHVYIFLACCMIFSAGVAQSKKYKEFMKKNIQLLDSAKDNEVQYLAAAIGFEKMIKQEPKEWLPNYYAGLCYVYLAYKKEGEDIDKFADKADMYINRADSLIGKNAEIAVLRSMNASVRILVDPMSRGFQYGKESHDHSEAAVQLDPENPRAYANKGISTFYTPAAFGGGPAKAKPFLEKALEKYKTFKSPSELHPHWGKKLCEQLLKQCNEG